jgi:hypothetical protein
MWRSIPAVLAALLLLTGGPVPGLAEAGDTPAAAGAALERPRTSSPETGDPSGKSGGSAPPDLEALIADVGPVPGRVIDAAIEGEGRTANMILGTFIANRNAHSRIRLARALALAQQAAGDRRIDSRGDLNAMMNRVSIVAHQALNSPFVVDVTVRGGFVPPPGTRAYDLGPADTPLAAGFETMTAQDTQVTGAFVRSLRVIGTGALLFEGLRGVERITARLPNGSYRVVVLTGRPTDPALSQPFGAMLRANAETFYIGTTPRFGPLPSAWVVEPVLVDAAARRGYAQAAAREALRREPERDPGGGGLGIAFRTEVVDGTLDLRFVHMDPDKTTAISAVLVQPAHQEALWVTDRSLSVLQLSSGLLDALGAEGEVDPKRAAAVVAYAVHRRPDRAEAVVRAGLRLFPDAAAEIVAAVAGLDEVAVERLTAWVKGEPRLSTARKRAALERLPQQAMTDAP